MPFEVGLPRQLREEERYVTLILASDTAMPTVDGQWSRGEDGRITAWYSRAQLCEAVLAGLRIEIGRMEERLERGERMMVKARERGANREAAVLEQHWVKMLEDMTRLLDVQAAAQAR